MEQQKKKQYSCQQLARRFQKLGFTARPCDQMAAIACGKNQRGACDLDRFQREVETKRRRRRQDKNQQQQHMVPFLFQQSVDKTFDKLDLFYYDEVWSPQRQSGRGTRVNAAFQARFPYLRQVRKDSASPTIVYRGTHEGRRIFVKSFRCGRDEHSFDALPENVKTLSYEKEVYRYIRSVAVRDDEIRRHFIDMLFCAKDDTNGLAYIFSQDSGGRALQEYFLYERLTYNFVAGVMTQYLCLLRLLHDKLRVVHNDLHLGNVLVVRDNQPEKECVVGGKTFRLTDHPYTLMVYDFDESSIFEPKRDRNPFLGGFYCRKHGRCNDYPATDLFIYLQILLRYGTPRLFVDVRDKARYVLLRSVYMVLMPPALLAHVEAVKLEHAPCASVRDGVCAHPASAPDLVLLAGLWHDALHADTGGLLSDARYAPALFRHLVDARDFFGISLFLVVDGDGYRVVVDPTSRDVLAVVEANRAIREGNVASLILPNFQKHVAALHELFFAQHNNTGGVVQSARLRQHLRQVRQAQATS